MPRPLVLLALALSLIACHGSPTEPAPPRATLAGTVSFFEGGPAAGATVRASMNMFSGTPETPSPETVTDEQGRYSLTLNAGQHTVSVRAPGATSTSRIQIIEVPPGTTTANFEVSSSGCAIINGRIMDGVKYTPISGATVSFLGQTMISGSDGAYRFNLGCPPPAKVSDTMIVDHPSYQRREFVLGVPTWSMTTDIWLLPR
jgi:hypothetical protein